MPAAITHFYHIDQVLKKLDEKGIKVNEALVRTGSIFPDVFFFGRGHFSELIHNENVSETFRMLALLKDEYDVDFYSFAIGVLGHYYLDVNSHPYIFYKTGKYVKGIKETKKYRSLHLNFEYRLDNYFAKLLYKRRLARVKVNKQIANLKDELKDLLNKNLSAYYGSEIKVEKALKAYKRYYRLIGYDPIGIKKVIYRVIDIFRPNATYKLKDLSLFVTEYPGLNLSKSKWLHASMPNKISSESYLELLDKAIDELFKKALELHEYLNKKIDSIEFGNLNLDSGVDCGMQAKITNFEF